jgi:hypothetical protein
MYGYLSFSQLATIIRTQLHRVPKSVDLIVGIPRSGCISTGKSPTYKRSSRTGPLNTDKRVRSQ